MEMWIIGNKLSLLLYLVIAVSILAPAASPWDILAYLIYLSVNIAIPTFRYQGRLPLLLAVSSGALVVLFAFKLNTQFFLLLPTNLYELALLSADRNRHAATPRDGRGSPLPPGELALLALSIVPLLLIPLEERAVYVLGTASSLLLYMGLRGHTERLKRLDEDRETLRAELQRVSRSLSDSREYLRQSEYTIKLEERNRLSQRIHDEVGHAVAGALIQMEASRRLLGADPAKAAELLGNAIAISKEGLERIRLTLKDMKPRTEELGIHRLRLFADELSAKRQVKTTVTHDGDLDLITPLHWKIIHDNAMEAVTNALKYSQATAVEIEVRVLNRMIRLVVADNGVGAPKIVKGLGIVGMEERAASAGGTVIVDGMRGFRVTTLLPMHVAME